MDEPRLGTLPAEPVPAAPPPARFNGPVADLETPEQRTQDRLVTGRYRGLQLASVALIGLGLGGLAGLALLSGGGINSANLLSLALLALGAPLLLIVGLLLNAVRALIVRGALLPARYRGPAVLVLLGLALIGSLALSLPFAQDAAVLLGMTKGQPSALGSFVVLSALQVSLVIVTAAFVLVPGALAGTHLVPWRRLLPSLLMGVGFGIPAWIAATILGAIVQRLLALIGYQAPAQAAEAALGHTDPAIAIVAFVVVAPIAEELFFRGVAFNAWLREYGLRRALYGSALLFAVIHASVAAFLPILGLGLALAWVYRRTGSLASNIAMHATFNAISVGLALLARAGIFQLPN